MESAMSTQEAWFAGICMGLVFLFICAAAVWLHWRRPGSKNKE